MAQMKSHVIQVENGSNLGEKAQQSLQNSQVTAVWPISSYTSAQQVHTYRQFSTRENGQTRFHEFRVIIIIIIFFFFFLFKPAISLLEPIEALIFPLNGMELCTDIQRLFFICCTSQRHFTVLSGVKRLTTPYS